MLMFCVATLTQYCVTGVLVFSAAAAGDAEQTIIAAAVTDVHFRRSMVVLPPFGLSVRSHVHRTAAVSGSEQATDRTRFATAAW
jgi:hypothetical protein